MKSTAKRISSAPRSIAFRPLYYFLRSMLFIIVTAAMPLAARAVEQSGAPHIAAALALGSTKPAPGKTISVAITMTPQSGWHGYWINPGDSGLPVSVEWEAPAGVRFGPLKGPAPQLLNIAGIRSYVHEGPFTLIGKMTVSAAMAKGTALPITANLSWLSCSASLCVPESTTLSANLTIGAGGSDPGGAAIIDAAERALPRPLAGDAQLMRRGGALTFSISAPKVLNLSKIRLFPADEGWFSPDAVQHVSRTGNRLILRIAGDGTREPPFVGVVADGKHAYRITIAALSDAIPGASRTARDRDAVDVGAMPTPVGTSSEPKARGEAAVSSAPSGTSDKRVAAVMLLPAFLSAIIGGLLLNLMPCVFPILSLKALSLARAGADRAEARQEGLAYAGGSIVSALALGGVLITLRSAGEEIGWSFQLQSPHVVALLLALTTAIALNLAGLFEFCAPAINGGGAIRSGSRGAFATGALAAVIATPCSGPFMAGALGAALILSPPAALLIFAGLGLGMALPFLAIAWIPALQRRMPKPGKWMETFRRILSLPMLATAMALAWILGRQTGVGGMTIGLALAVVVGVSLWWLGNRQRENRPVWRTLVPAAAAVIAVLAVDLPQSDAATKQTRVDGRHQPFDVVRLQQLRAAGTPVFLDFTADWCLTCKVNEKLAINTDATRTAFRHAGVVTMIGDWTQGDPAITRFLEAHGRNSIPFYIYYPPAGEPQLLPQILTPALLSSLSSGQTGGS